MRRITSITKAIEYFEKGSTRKQVKTIGGQEYTSVVPPASFHRLRMTYSNGISFVSEAWSYGDYAKELREESQGESKRTNGRLVKILLYIDD